MSQSPAKDKAKGVQRFKHFPTNFVRPYGPTAFSPGDETIWNRLQTFNCELLQRPKVGISELAASIEADLNSLLNSNYTILDNVELKDIIEKTKTLSAALNPLEKGSGIKIECKHVIEMLKEFFRDDDTVVNVMHEAFMVGSTLYTMAIQFLVARAVFPDPQQYSRMLPMTTEGAKAFKENPSVKGLKQFLFPNVVTVDKESSTSKLNSSSLLAQLESSDDETILKPTKLSHGTLLQKETKGKGKGKTKRPLHTDEEEEEEEDSDRSDETTAKRRKKQLEKEISVDSLQEEHQEDTNEGPQKGGKRETKIRKLKQQLKFLTKNSRKMLTLYKKLKRKSTRKAKTSSNANVRCFIISYLYKTLECVH
jgi:hypothetical protein